MLGGEATCWRAGTWLVSCRKNVNAGLRDHLYRKQIFASRERSEKSSLPTCRLQEITAEEMPWEMQMKPAEFLTALWLLVLLTDIHSNLNPTIKASGLAVSIPPWSALESMTVWPSPRWVWPVKGLTLKGIHHVCWFVLFKGILSPSIVKWSNPFVRARRGHFSLADLNYFPLCIAAHYWLLTNGQPLNLEIIWMCYLI